MYSMLLFILFVPSKGVIQGGRHLSLEQSRLSKDANIDISEGKMPMSDGKIVPCTRRERWSSGEKRKGQEPRRHQALGIRPLPSSSISISILSSTTVHNASFITDSNTSVGNPTVVMSINT
jgi:hypothetical protein